MLAEPKKRLKWTLNPRGNSWSQDANKFGQRMLEKMGWKSGEGLGINKQGITEHIKVAYKNDNKCLGYKDNGEQWVEHQSQFEILLAELSNSHITAAPLDSLKKKVLQTETLEERSRHSRTRVHYQKFTRGKDLSKCSKKDLECILGKKKANNVDEESQDGNGEDEHLNSFYGVKTVNSGTMNDYFKKFEKPLNSINCNSADVQFREEGINEKENKTEQQSEEVLKKKKKRKSKVQLSDAEICSIDDSSAMPSVEQHKKVKIICTFLEQSDTANEIEPTNEDQYPHDNISTSKKKHKKHSIATHEDAVIDTFVEKLDQNKTHKAKKHKKEKIPTKQNTECQVKAVNGALNDEMDNRIIKEKSKKKNLELPGKNSDTSAEQSFHAEESSNHGKEDIKEQITFEAATKRQIKKMNKRAIIDNTCSKENLITESVHKLADNAGRHDENRLTEENTEDSVSVKKKKKAKKRKEDHIEECLVECLSEDISARKKSKQKHKKKTDENVMAESVKEEKQAELNNIVGKVENLYSQPNQLKENHWKDSFTEHQKTYSSEEIKNMKTSLFSQLVNPKLVNFKGSNLHDITGYGTY